MLPGAFPFFSINELAQWPVRKHCKNQTTLTISDNIVHVLVNKNYDNDLLVYILCVVAFAPSAAHRGTRPPRQLNFLRVTVDRGAEHVGILTILLTERFLQQNRTYFVNTKFFTEEFKITQYQAAIAVQGFLSVFSVLFS